MKLLVETMHIPVGDEDLEGLFEFPEERKGVVVFAHGSGSSRFSPRNNYVANILHRARLGTLLMDLLTRQEDRDIENRFNIALLTQRLAAAIHWINERHIGTSLPIGIFGASTGAAAALEVAASPTNRIAAVVSRGGRPDLVRSDVLEKVTAPTLLIVGGFDSQVIELNRAAYASLRCEKRIEIVPGASHLFEEPGKLDAVAALAQDWFLRHLTVVGREPAMRKA
jgi:putative phosphoribosyl transferase